MTRRERVRERADLVGDITVGRDPVGPEHDRVDRSSRDQPGGGRVDDQLVRDSECPQLPHGQPGTLQQRARLGGDHPVKRPAPGERRHDGQSGAVTGRRERPGVAMGEHTTDIGEQFGARVAHGAAGGELVVVDPLGRGQRGFEAPASAPRRGRDRRPRRG